MHASTFPLPARVAAATLALAALTSAPAAQSLTVIARDAVLLPGTTTDQHGTPFSVTGLSGVSSLGGGSFVCVMDNSDKLVFVDVTLDGDAMIVGATITGGLSLEHARDYEGVAPAGRAGTVFLSEEGTPGVHEYDMADGLWIRSLATPPVYSSLRSNRGFESLTRLCSSGALWTANEEALTVDGPAASPSSGSVVRLLHVDPDGSAAQQLAYEIESMHGPFLPGGAGQSGLSELVALPDGSLLALERSLAVANPLYLSRLYLVDPAGATDVSALPGLAGASYTPVGKQLLWSGSASNLEGLTLGPRLGPNRWALIGVVDDGDPLSTNQLVSFELTGPPLDECECVTTTTCSTSPNSAGPGARISAAGSTRIGDDDFTLVVSGGVPGKSGLFYYGPESVELPFGEGLRCVGAGASGIFRLGPPVAANPDGIVERPVDFAAPPMGSGPGLVSPGSRWYFQYWYRDPMGGPNGFNLSDALEVSFCP